MISIPFSGSKRNRYKEVRKIVEDNGYTKVYEPFGGSAVLSVNLFREGLVDKAIINDYDHLFDLYPAYLDIKDNLIRKCLDKGFTKGNKRINEEQRCFLQSEIMNCDKRYWHLLSSNFVFSGRRTAEARLSDFVYFMNDITTDKQREYLKTVSQVERDSLDYKDFIKKHYKDFDDTTLLIVDPPYMNSEQKAYNNQTFFRLAETLKLLTMLKDMGIDFIFFNMVERDVIEVLKLFGFKNFEVRTRRVSQSATSIREDCMVYVRSVQNAK